MTVNKAHGMTCDSTMLLGDDLLYRELAYEALSRGRLSNRIYMSRGCMVDLDLTVEDGPHARSADAHSHLAAHHADQIELDAIADVLRERTREQTNRAVSEPPSYITKGLGPRPADRVHDRAWVSAVVAIECYRIEHDITDRRTTLGPRPTNNDDINEWDHVAGTIRDALQLIAAPPARTVQSRRPAIERASLGIEM